MIDYFELTGRRSMFRPEPGESAWIDRVRAWEAVFERWLCTLRTKEARRRYLRIWADFLNYGDKLPWERDAAFVKSWELALYHRGWSPVTLDTYHRALASFYRFAFREREAGGLHAALAVPDENPAPGRDRLPPNRFGALSLDPPAPYQTARALAPWEVSGLFAVIDVDSPFGRRDYVLYLVYLATGAEKRCIRTLRWGDIEVEAGRAWYHWRARPRGARDDPPPRRSLLPACAWQAIREYLFDAGRLEDMRPGDCVFTPLTDISGRLNPAGDPDWYRARPISRASAYHNLAMYARWAGLDRGRATFTALRYTSVLLRAWTGQSEQAICAELGYPISHLTPLLARLRATDGPGDWSEVIAELGLSFE